MARVLLEPAAVWWFLFSTLWTLKLGSGVPMLASLSHYEAALVARLHLDRSEGLRGRVNARHLLPRVRVAATANQWDRLTVDGDVDDGYRRQGMGISVSLEFRLPEIAYDPEERAVLTEARAARKEQQELITQLHRLFWQAKEAIASEDPSIEAAIRAVEAIAYGASCLAEGER